MDRKRDAGQLCRSHCKSGSCLCMKESRGGQRAYLQSSRNCVLGAGRKDKFSKAKRSQVMAKIKSRYTGLDLKMKELLTEEGMSFEMYPKVYGHPDFLVSGKLAIFCDSDFWHGRDWRSLRHQLERGSNATYWISHIKSNRARDRKVNAKLSI